MCGATTSLVPEAELPRSARSKSAAVGNDRPWMIKVPRGHDLEVGWLHSIAFVNRVCAECWQRHQEMTAEGERRETERIRRTTETCREWLSRAPTADLSDPVIADEIESKRAWLRDHEDAIDDLVGAALYRRKHWRWTEHAPFPPHHDGVLRRSDPSPSGGGAIWSGSVSRTDDGRTLLCWTYAGWYDDPL